MTDPLFVPSEDVIALVKKHADIAILSLKEPHCSWLPRVAIHTMPADGKESQIILYAVVTDFNEDDEKKMVAIRIGRNLYERRVFPRVLILSAEAWMSRQEIGKNQVEPRHDPSREEVIIVTGMDVLRKHVCSCTIPITHDGQGNIVPGKPGEVLLDGECRLLSWVMDGFSDAWRGEISRRN